MTPPNNPMDNAVVKKTIEDFKDFNETPLNNNIVIYIPPIPKKTKGGIILPDADFKEAILRYFGEVRHHLVVAVAQLNSSNVANLEDVVLDFQPIRPGDYVSFDASSISSSKIFTNDSVPQASFMIIKNYEVETVIKNNGTERAEKDAKAIKSLEDI